MKVTKRVQDLRKQLVQEWVIAGSDIRNYGEMVTEKLKAGLPKTTTPSRFDSMEREPFIKELFTPNPSSTADDIIGRAKKRAQRSAAIESLQSPLPANEPTEPIEPKPSVSKAPRTPSVATIAATEEGRRWNNFYASCEAKLNELELQLEILKALESE